MSAPRRRATVDRDVRAELIDRARERCERYRDRVEVNGAMFVSPWARWLAALEAGAPVELPAFAVPAWARGAAGPSGRMLVDRDGSVRPVARS